LTSVAADLTATYNAMTTLNGLDAPEAQIEALMQLALRTSEVGFRADSARFVVLFTDAPFHVAGDGAAAGITTPNNGDAILDGTPEGTGEDYPMIAQLKSALEAANIIPIFAIAGGFQSTYQALADQLGRGTVVTLTANSSNVVDAITAGITAATVTIIEDAIGGEGNDTLIGNDAENHLAGNGGDDHLEGGAGDDTADYGRNSGRYSVFHADTDTYTITGKGAAAGDGTDTLTGMEFAKFADGTFALAALAAGVTVTGTTGNDVITPKNSAVGNGDDTLTGLEGNDVLNGGRGGDTMEGGLGNDTFVVDNGADQTVELAGEGRDTVKANLSWTLAGNVERLMLTGSAAIDGTGNDLNNLITGNGADNVLEGLGGRDTYAGGDGADTFVFGPALAGNEDHVLDFASGIDHAAVRAADYGLAAGALDPGIFELGAAASLGLAEFLFDSATGTLYWDEDGIAGGEIAIATFDGGITLAASDLLVL
ncbi:MAG: hypothetical protein KDK75_17680, partial [Alphaproteobacteria bacterium]|nr:hypothetical protein [Alphaproteobacteria bacterium]